MATPLIQTPSGPQAAASGVDNLPYKSGAFKAIVGAIAGFTADRIIQFANRAGIVLTSATDPVAVAHAGKLMRVNTAGTDLEAAPAWLKTQAVTANTATTWNGDSGLDYVLTLTGDVALTISNIPYGFRGKLQVVQDATGGRSLTFANAAVIGANVNTAANAITIYEVIPSANGIPIVFNLSSTSISSSYTAGSYTATIQAGPLTGNQIAYLPNNSGTLATIDQLRPFALTRPILYVATNGLASNDGLTAATPLATIEQALAKFTKIDHNGFDPIINLAAGLYTLTTAITLPDLVGVATRCTIQGPATAIIRDGRAVSPQVGLIRSANSTRYRLDGIRIESLVLNSYHKLIEAREGALELRNLTLSGGDLFCDGIVANGGSASIEIIGTMTLAGSFRYVFAIIGGSLKIWEVVFAGTATFDIWLLASGTSTAMFNNTSTGSFTGKRYELQAAHIKAYPSPPGTVTSIGSIAGTYSYPTAPG